MSLLALGCGNQLGPINLNRFAQARRFSVQRWRNGNAATMHGHHSGYVLSPLLCWFAASRAARDRVDVVRLIERLSQQATTFARSAAIERSAGPSSNPRIQGPIRAGHTGPRSLDTMKPGRGNAPCHWPFCKRRGPFWPNEILAALFNSRYTALQQETRQHGRGTLIYRRTGNLRAVQLLLGHRKIESTVRYLGIEADDALAIAEQVDV